MTWLHLVPVPSAALQWHDINIISIMGSQITGNWTVCKQLVKIDKKETSKHRISGTLWSEVTGYWWTPSEKTDDVKRTGLTKYGSHICRNPVFKVKVCNVHVVRLTSIPSFMASICISSHVTYFINGFWAGRWVLVIFFPFSCKNTRWLLLLEMCKIPTFHATTVSMLYWSDLCNCCADICHEMTA